jgi:hypothetical protein
MFLYVCHFILHRLSLYFPFIVAAFVYSFFLYRVLTLSGPCPRSLPVGYLITWHLAVSPRGCIHIHERQLWFTKSTVQTEKGVNFTTHHWIKMPAHCPLKCVTSKKVQTTIIERVFFSWDRKFTPIRYIPYSNRSVMVIRFLVTRTVKIEGNKRFDFRNFILTSTYVWNMGSRLCKSDFQVVAVGI